MPVPEAGSNQPISQRQAQNRDPSRVSAARLTWPSLPWHVGPVQSRLTRLRCSASSTRSSVSARAPKLW